MRKEFAASMQKAGADPRVIFITGDLGFMALENVREALGKRFINAGVSEQNMVSLAAGLASKGLTVVCYSIAPFAVFRPAEQVRLDVGLHNMDVKIVGNGGGYGYGIMGATHHAIEDIAVMSSFQNMRCYVPFCNEDVDGAVKEMMKRKGPAYLRLGYGGRPQDIGMPAFMPVRKLLEGSRVTVIGMGPVVLNAIQAARAAGAGIADIFAVSEMPLYELPVEFTESIRKTGKVLVVEEHVSRGGLGENLALLLINGAGCRLVHKCALGYPDGTYGSQAYHQRMCGLDPDSLLKDIKEMADE
jgi:transketolase